LAELGRWVSGKTLPTRWREAKNTRRVRFDQAHSRQWTTARACMAVAADEVLDMSNSQVGTIGQEPLAITHKKPVWPLVVLAWPTLTSLFVTLPQGLTYALYAFLLLAALVFWAASNEKFDPTLFWAIAPICLMIVIGLIGGHGADRYLYLKDAWYTSNAVVNICVGYVLYRCHPNLTNGLRVLVVCGVVGALSQLSIFVFHPELLQKSAAQIRDEIGFGSSSAILALAILFAYGRQWSAGLKLPPWFAAACLVLCGLGIVASFSRQGLVIAIISMLAAVGTFAKREWLRLGGVAIVGIAALIALRSSMDIDVNSFQSSFLGKLARAPEELLIRDYPDRTSIIANWRGYETSQAFRTYSSGTPFELVVGQGFGHSLYLGLFMNLGSSVPGVRERINSAPILHNGFAFILLKTGPISVVLFLCSLGWLYLVGRKQASSTSASRTAPARLLQACALICLVTTWVSMGTLSGGTYVLTAGYLLAALTRGAEPST
jgi:uncharacterized membrane protein YhdT